MTGKTTALALLLAIGGLFPAAGARAACTDFPARGVDWSNCLMQDQQL